jgi:dTMP kinase
MKIHNCPGFFIDIEGLDGSGASTQVRLVSQRLRSMGLKPYLTKEPTKGPIGKLVRSALKGEFNSLPPSSVQMLFAADRGRHLEGEIIPRLKKGEMVITDRYAWSSVAFGSLDLDKEWLFGLNKDFILPDLTIFIEVSPGVCLERIAKERETLELFERRKDFADVWDTYHYLATKYWWAKIVVIDGEQPVEKITEEILSAISRHPKFKRK